MHLGRRSLHCRWQPGGPWEKSIHCAADSIACTQHLLDGAFELLGQALAPHLPSNIEDNILGKIAVVLDVLGLLTVTLGFLELLDDQTGGIWLNIDLGCPVLNGEPHSHPDSLPGRCTLNNIITNFLW